MIAIVQISDCLGVPGREKVFKRSSTSTGLVLVGVHAFIQQRAAVLHE